MVLDDAKMRKAYIRPLEPIDLFSATKREQSSLYFGRERAHGQGAGATVDAKNKVLYLYYVMRRLRLLHLYHPLHCYIITYPLPQRDFVLLCPGPCSTLHLNVLKRNSDLHKDIKGGGDEREFIGPLLSADGCARAHTHTPALTPCDCESSLRVLPRIVYQIGY
jgi:hypothetical protein